MPPMPVMTMRTRCCFVVSEPWSHKALCIRSTTSLRPVNRLLTIRGTIQCTLPAGSAPVKPGRQLMLIKAGTAPTKLLTTAAVPIRYHGATVFDHPAQLWQ
jgi:hypothetical protein